MLKVSILVTILLLSLHNLAFSGQSKQIRVAVIDTGLDLDDSRFKEVLCKEGHKDFTNTTIKDNMPYGHGTAVASIIKEKTKNSNYCLLILKVYDVVTKDPKIAEAIWYAALKKADIINLSMGGEAYEELEYRAIAQNQSVIVVATAGNNKRPIKWFPCASPLPNIRCVGSSAYPDKYDDNSISNYGSWVKYWHDGTMVKSYSPGSGTSYQTGTSFATPQQTAVEIMNFKY